MTTAPPSQAFEGFPPAAFAFYAELEEPGNNTRAWFDANRDRYERDVRRPVEALLASAAGEFGTHAKVFRPHRDVRFSPDKRPYKTSVAMPSTTTGMAPSSRRSSRPPARTGSRSAGRPWSAAPAGSTPTTQVSRCSATPR